MKFKDADILEIEKILLPQGCAFSDEGKAFLQCNKSTEVLACPGSGKTTLLMAKLWLISKSMPFADNSGICVLSHTNIAVDEIKSRLGENADKILGYPNFVGTIQSFIDKFVVFPYLTNFTDTSIQVLDEREYAKRLWGLCNVNKGYSLLKYVIENNVKINKQYKSPEEFIKDLYLDSENNLYVGKIKRKVSGNDKPSAKQFLKIKYDLLKTQGVIKYIDAYILSRKALESYGDSLKKLMAKRFKYVFIDEYQDCNLLQCEVINTVFDNTILQKIGDVDQAIYNNGNDVENPWVVSDNALPLTGSNRYHQKIADVLTPLRTNKEPITSMRNNIDIQPTLIIYDDNNISEVIKTFASEIRLHKLNESASQKCFKAIGATKNGKGITIENYWSQYKKDEKANQKNVLSDYVFEFNEYLKEGDLHRTEQLLRDVLKKILYELNIKNKHTGKFYTSSSLKNLLSVDAKLFEIYNQCILDLCKLTPITTNGIKNILITLLKTLFDTRWNEFLNEFISREYITNNTEKTNLWTDSSKENDLQIIVTNVHKVKGETHTATLYLETETQRSSDIKRVLQLLDTRKKHKTSEIHEKARRILYVGLSRPTHLLCLAIHSNTYLNNEMFFADWKRICLNKEGG